MEKTIRIRVDKTLQEAMEDFRRELALDLKAKYNLETITIHSTLASQILAAKIKGQKFLQVRIKKNGLNKGTLELL